MKRFAFVLALALAANPGLADTALPALHDVTGVAANDVLNLRAAPSASAAIIGSLPPGLSGVEVTVLSADGKWGRINQSEASGWAAMAFLKAQGHAPWFTLQHGLRCYGAEPFWTLFVNPTAKSAQFLTPDAQGPQMNITTNWPGEDWRPVAGVEMNGDTGSTMAVIRAEACSDGMSDAAFGLSVDLFSQGTTAAPAPILRGCCTLEP